MARFESERVIRGEEVKVFADSFDGDPSVGIPYGPEEVWATTFDGNHFDLTSEEEEKIAEDAIDYLWNDDSSF